MKTLYILHILLLALVSIVNANIFHDFSDEDYFKVKESRNFTGKVVLVTGSDSGIGAGIVKLFSILGASVVVTGRKAPSVHKVAQEIQELSPYKLKPLEVVADVTKTEDLKRLLSATVDRFGRLDVLVNNAGIYKFNSIEDQNITEEWDQIFAVDLRAIVELNHLAVPLLEKTNGAIIDMSSIEAMKPISKFLAYNCAKAALDMMTRVLAIELGPKGIRVNSLNPGYTDVPNALLPKELVDLLKKSAPLGRVAFPLDVAKGVVFLASTDAQFITGANLVVDGGLIWTMPPL